MNERMNESINQMMDRSIDRSNNQLIDQLTVRSISLNWPKLLSCSQKKKVLGVREQLEDLRRYFRATIAKEVFDYLASPLCVFCSFCWVGGGRGVEGWVGGWR